MKNRVILLAALCVAIPGVAQEFPKPGPEHEMLKKQEGVWDCVIKAGPEESKGTMTNKMELGGLWLVSSFEGSFGGLKFQGRGLDTYDAGKKKFISVWVDSMSTSPMVFEGTYDAAKKTLTMTAEGPGMDGKPTKFKSVTEHISADAMKFSMFMGDEAAPMMTIDYKRKK